MGKIYIFRLKFIKLIVL